MNDSSACPFCHLPPERILLSSQWGKVFRDGFPVSNGHTLVVPHRHVASWLELSVDERADLFNLLAQAQQELQTQFQPNAYNVGINDGPAAGQTVPHMHIHLIPRYAGDHPDPRGGIRWVLPEKAKYWS
ncbi:MAG: HIT family protein [Burkholderiaceae bacterium]|nr:HIT family protein [Burkholderiaceae bacterium]